MSLTKVALWAGLILLICYMFGISPTGVIGSVSHAVQQAHNSSVNNGHP